LSSIRNLRYVALIEATTFLALLVATFIKYQDSSPQGVQILGPIHGIFFLCYVFLALNVRSAAGWDAKTTLLVLLGAVLPFGGYVVDRWLSRQTLAAA